MSQGIRQGVDAHRVHPRGGQPVELGGEQDNHQHTKVKRGDGHPKIGESADGVIHPGVFFVGGDQPQRNGQRQRDQQRNAHQQNGGGQAAGQQRPDRRFRGQGVAEVALDRFFRPAQILLGQAFVQAQHFNNGLLLLFRHIRAQIHRRNVAWRDVDDGEGEKGNQHHHHSQLPQFAQTIIQHRLFLSSAPPKRDVKKGAARQGGPCCSGSPIVGVGSD